VLCAGEELREHGDVALGTLPLLHRPSRVEQFPEAAGGAERLTRFLDLTRGRL
jgi:hypothetical protein